MKESIVSAEKSYPKI